MQPAAVRAGVGPRDFWRLTPGEIHMAVVAAEKRQVTQAWWVARLARVEKLPALTDLLGERPETAGLTREQVEQARADIAARQSPEAREALLRMAKGGVTRG